LDGSMPGSIPAASTTNLSEFLIFFLCGLALVHCWSTLAPAD
jgi:hypothetical protein